MKNKGWHLKGISILMSFIMITGCSTTFGRQHDEQMVTFDANVQDVEVNCSGKRTMTPGAIPLRQSKNHTCFATKEGYEKKVFNIRSGTSWAGFGHSTATNGALWGWWTLGIGVGIGWLIDWPSGAMRNLKDDNIYIELRPKGSTGTAKAVLEKAMDAGKTIATMPADVVQETTGAILDTAVHDSATQMGLNTTERKTE